MAHRANSDFRFDVGTPNGFMPQVRDVSSSASWRTSRLSHGDVIARIVANGLQVSPLFKTPWISVELFRIDWLHCADQGITADFLGNLFKLLADKCDGRNRKARTLALWTRIQQFYIEHRVGDRLQNLTDTMIQQPGKGPKLRCSAAQCRALVPFAWQCSQALFGTTPMEEAAKTAAHHLHKCYEALRADCVAPYEILRSSSTQFALQYVALGDHVGNPLLWKCKPKLHLFLELCSESSRPSLCWNYRDEDFGGSIAKTSRRRGGLLSCKALSSNVLRKMLLQQPVLRMLSP